MTDLLADLTVLTHAGFVLFATTGGLLVWRWPGVAWVHLPAVVWAVGVEWVGALCPLTILEHWLRRQAGGAVEAGDFIDRYVLWWLYPAGLTRELQVGLGVALLAVNVVVYGRLLRLRRAASRRPGAGRSDGGGVATGRP